MKSSKLELILSSEERKRDEEMIESALCTRVVLVYMPPGAWGWFKTSIQYLASDVLFAKMVRLRNIMEANVADGGSTWSLPMAKAGTSSKV